MPRAIRGKLRSDYSTWPLTNLPHERQIMFRGVLLDDVGEWWSCDHRHGFALQATRCAQEKLAERPEAG